MIIDCHVHIGEDIFGSRNNILTFNGSPQKQELNEFVYKMRIYNIDKALVFPFPSPLKQYDEDIFWYHKENKDNLEDLKENRNIEFIPAFNPKDQKSVNYAFDLIERYNLKGLKLHTRATKYDPSRLEPYILKFLEDNGIPLILHVGSGKEPELREENIDISLKSSIYIAEKYPDNLFVFAHLGRLDRRLEEALNLDNVLLDTAALSLKEVLEDFISLDSSNLASKNPKDIIRHLIEEGYEDKIMWGSDEPYGLSYKKEMDYVLDNSYKISKRKIIYKNAKKLFRL